MNYKFTADGKKVVIIGPLNTRETIVQEIFVADGEEFPAGEHFIVKTLLDKPAETWRAKEERRAKESVEMSQKECRNLEVKISNYQFAAKAAAEKVKWIQGIKEPEVERVYENIKSVICGEYTHIVFDEYDGLEIREWDAKLFSRTEGYGENKRFDGIRLISLYGTYYDTRLELAWRVHTYSDGSGSGSTTFFPCKSLQEAVATCAKIINKKGYINDKDVEFCMKYGIVIDELKNSERLRKKRENIEKEIAKIKDMLITQMDKLGEYR